MASTILILDNIRSAHNVGSLFRTADGAGVAKLYCIGTTPAPIDRFGRKRADIAKVSLGAEEYIAWEHIADDDVTNLLKRLKKEGYTIVALEQSGRSIGYKEVFARLKSKPIALIVGNEVGGVSKGFIDMSDVVAEIPMVGNKESLNVSVAAGIALFQIE